MAEYQIGDLVVLKSGSMRMCVEDLSEDGAINVVWCNEGVIGRDAFSPALLNKWEHREDSGRGGHDRSPGSGRPFSGGSGGGGKSFGGPRGPGRGKRHSDDGDDSASRRHSDGKRPAGKTGWDGKPRDKKFYRKDD